MDPTKLSSPPTRWDALQWATSRLVEQHLENPRLNAEWLLCHAIQAARIELYLNPHQPLSLSQWRRFRRIVQQRRQQVPLQYLTGQAAFFSRQFLVTPAVLIPRPETEVLVETVLERIRRVPERTWAVDLGTGSGIIAITLAQESPDTMVFAVDSSSQALAVAAENCRRHAVSERVHLIAGNLFDPFIARGCFDWVVANPPYIPSAEIPRLAVEVRCFEPHQALDGGPDGTTVLCRILDQAPCYLRPGGTVFLEMGADQAASLTDHLQHKPAYGPPQIRRDYAGRERILVVSKKGEGVGG